MGEFKNFTVSGARPLPVIILADISGSMSENGKINALNQAMKEMLNSFSSEADQRAEIHVSVITFGGTAKVFIPLGPVGKIKWSDMTADGNTPLGEALAIAGEMIEDKSKVPGNSYKPTVVLVSDGRPNDQNWEEQLNKFVSQGRSSKTERITLAIGGDADKRMLEKFLNDPQKKVFYAEDASKIKDFFRFVSMSVTLRSKSIDPNKISQTVDVAGLHEIQW